MKIEVVTYDAEWPNEFNQIKLELQSILKKINPVVEHIGSTAVPGLAAKPVVDIAIGISSVKDLEKTIDPMLQSNYIYYKVYNTLMPKRRFFVRLKNREDIVKFKNIYEEGNLIPHQQLQAHKLCHIHIWEFGSTEWTRHIAFRNYLIAHAEIRNQYALLKKKLSLKNWVDGNHYNDEKNSFIKTEEAKAVLWYKKLNNK